MMGQADYQVMRQNVRFVWGTSSSDVWLQTLKVVWDRLSSGVRGRL